MTVEKSAQSRTSLPRLRAMNTPQQKSQRRLLLAFGLFLASIAASLLFSIAANKSQGYWVLARPVPSGVQITQADLQIQAALLPHTELYFHEKSESPVGSITLRAMKAGELIDRRYLSDNSLALTTENISIAIAASDIPLSANVGDVVTLYQIHDSRNGEVAIPPRRIISGAFIAALDSRKGNFGGELSLTLSVNREEVASVLAATSSGRLVLVGSHG